METSEDVVQNVAQDVVQLLTGLITETGFEAHGCCPASALRIVPEVRDMCAEDKCNSFGKSWSCPPACGTLDDFEALFRSYGQCIVFQTVYPLEDEFDIEAMFAANRLHEQRFHELAAKANASLFDIALFSAGTCTLCGRGMCTYPDAPCCHPELMRPSMEAAGLWVSEVCEAAHIPYNHGSLTMTYTSCALV